MRLLFILILMATQASHALAQALPERKALEAGTIKLIQAVKKNDWRSVFDMMPPDLLMHLRVTRAQMLALAETPQFKKTTAAMQLLSHEKPTPILREQGVWASVIRTEMRLKLESSRLRVSGAMLALSKDEGKTWYFMNMSKNDKDKLKGYLPKTLLAKLDKHFGVTVKEETP